MRTKPASFRQRYFHIRVVVLLFVLLGVATWRARILVDENYTADWRTWHEVLVCPLLAPGSDWTRLEPGIAASPQRLADWGRAQFDRYGGGQREPLRFHFADPVAVASLPPRLAGANDGFLARYRATRAFLAYFHAQDPRFPLWTQLGSRVYVVIYPRDQPPGEDEQHALGTRRGRVGIVVTSDDPAEWGNTLAVIVHEALHTVGAQDHRDPNGNIAHPSGFAEPDASPLYPQRKAEVMALGIPLSASEELRVAAIEEVVVGPATAREIGWQP